MSGLDLMLLVLIGLLQNKYIHIFWQMQLIFLFHIIRWRYDLVGLQSIGRFIHRTRVELLARPPLHLIWFEVIKHVFWQFQILTVDYQYQLPLLLCLINNVQTKQTHLATNKHIYPTNQQQYNEFNFGNNFKLKTKVMTYYQTKFYQQNLVTKQLTKKYLKKRMGLNQQGVERKTFQPKTLDEQQALLKRIHLNIQNTPQINIIRGIREKIEIALRTYKCSLAQQMGQYNHHQKIECLIKLTQTYQALVKQYGFFTIQQNHIRFDEHQRMALWIHHHFFENKCSHALSPNQASELSMVKIFMGLIKKFFHKLFFQQRSIVNLKDLQNYLLFVDKRNKIHKKCQKTIMEKSITVRSATLSPSHSRFRNCSIKWFDSIERPKNYSLMASNVASRTSRAQSKQASYFNMCLSSNNISKGLSDAMCRRSEIESTFETDALSRKNVNSLQVSNIVKVPQNKSSIQGQIYRNSQNRPNLSTLIQKSKLTSSKINTHFSPILNKKQIKIHSDGQIMSKPSKQPLISKCSKEVKTSVEIGLNNLFLSQINEDSDLQNQFRESDLNHMEHFKSMVNQFQNILFN